ncbi:MAG: hypothetical protein ACR2GR_00395 [Rhodothermales bacterium]
MTDLHEHRIELLSTSFRYPAKWLFFARARLYFDRIELVGWTLEGKQVTQIQRSNVERIEWDVMARGASNPNVVFHLEGDRQIGLCLDQVHRWQDMLEERIGWEAGRPAQVMHYHALFETPADLPFRDLVAYASSMS